jgi:hypothetical protein
VSLERHHLEDAAIGALSCAAASGEVIIITNANFQWVKYSLTHFFPNLFSFLIENKIPIISSHALFSSKSPSHPSLWKYQTFHLMMQSLISSGRSLHHFTSIGDSVYEKIASQSISSKYQIPCHLIEFLPTPTISQLTQQLQILQHHLQSNNLSSHSNDVLRVDSQSVCFSSSLHSFQQQDLLPFSMEVCDDRWSPVINCEYEMRIQSPISGGAGHYDDDNDEEEEEEDKEIIELLLIKRSPSFDSTSTLFL